MEKISLVIPIFNENNTIAEFILSLNKYTSNSGFICECIFVDDGSNDGTTDVLEKHNFKVLRHKYNLGYGAAIKTGAQQATSNIICIIDADNEFPLEEINKLIPFINGCEMVVGKRDAINFPIHQKFAKFLICGILSTLFRQSILDINSGLRLIKKNIVSKYSTLLPNGFSFTSSITLAMLLDNYKINYVPITYNRRKDGSKVKPISYVIYFIISYLRILCFHIFKRE